MPSALSVPDLLDTDLASGAGRCARAKLNAEKLRRMEDKVRTRARPALADALKHRARALPAALPHKYPAVSTQAQVSFRAPDSDFVERFKAGREHGRPHDKETDYREKVFSMWNISGQKVPAVFRP